MTTTQRKAEHIHISLEKDVQFRSKTTGFEAYDFIHCALPEIDFENISTQTVFLNKTISYPLMISAMTGGHPDAYEMNGQLAEVCQEQKVAMGVGSQRQLLESRDCLDSYRVMRQRAPDVPIIGNIGGVELAKGISLSQMKFLIETLEADAMAVHLNPLQEILQPEGQPKFDGVLKQIEVMVRSLDIPVMVKEVGCGISEPVARKLLAAGVTYIDVAGAGGTSWAGIESYRGGDPVLSDVFWDWGIPTADALVMVKRVPGVRAIASGGIRDGITMAKALALGAELCGAAFPFLRMLSDGGKDGLADLLRRWKEELRIVMFLTESGCIEDLRDHKIEKKY